jgi:Uma2 family endonuclease
MSTGTLVSVEEYLSADYEHDCDYIDGVLEERPLGEFDHGRLQALLAAYFIAREKEWKLRTVVEVRIQIAGRRFRIPDITVILEPGPFTRIIRTPPFICIEILSPEDRMVRVLQRVDDYLAFGVAYVWVLDPQSKHAFVHTKSGVVESKDGILRTENPELVVPLAEIFESLA